MEGTGKLDRVHTCSVRAFCSPSSVSLWPAAEETTLKDASPTLTPGLPALGDLPGGSLLLVPGLPLVTIILQTEVVCTELAFLGANISPVTWLHVGT